MNKKYSNGNNIRILKGGSLWKDSKEMTGLQD